MNKFAASAFLTVVFGFYALTKSILAPSAVITPEPPVLASNQGISSSETSSISPYLDIPSSSSSSIAYVPTPVVVPVKRSSAPPASSIAASGTPPVIPSSSSAAPYIPSSSSSSSSSQGMYKDGTYTGPSVDAYYGYVQTQVTVQGGQIVDVQFLDYPQDRGQSIMINNYATPILRREAIQAQRAPVNAVSGATYTSQAFNESLAAALVQAKA